MLAWLAGLAFVMWACFQVINTNLNSVFRMTKAASKAWDQRELALIASGLRDSIGQWNWLVQSLHVCVYIYIYIYVCVCVCICVCVCGCVYVGVCVCVLIQAWQLGLSPSTERARGALSCKSSIVAMSRA